MPYSKRFLALAVVVACTLGNTTRAGSYSSSASNRYWWMHSDGYASWSSRNWASFNAYNTQAVSKPAASVPTPVYATSAYPSTLPAQAASSSPAPVQSTTASVSSTSQSAPLFAVPNNANTPTVAPVTSVYNTPVSTPSIATPAPSPSSTPHANGFINLGTGPFPNDSAITTGGTQPWYNSSFINGFFGGQPNAQQQASFNNAVLQDVQHSFALSGVNVTLTTNPNVPADHTLSVVSNTSAALLPSAIGMTQVGGNGFSFIDNEAKSAQSLQQLELIVAHNVAHELMLAFGVGENYDHTGKYIDAPNASFAMMTSDSATFSTAAANALNQALQNSSANANAAAGQLAQTFEAQPVPEPATIAIWTCGAFLGLALHRKRLKAKTTANGSL